LLVQDIPAKLQRECGVLAEAEEAVFTQVTALVNTFRDAVRFQNGVEVLLQRLNEGQRIRVLDLSFAEEQETIPKERQRVMI
jgi:redox-regulated HSP33 family molecular chaperone